MTPTDLEKKLAKVTGKVKAIAKDKYGIDPDGQSDDDNEDVDSLLCGPSSGKGKGKAISQCASATTMNLVSTTMERIEDRMIRFEGKMDDLYDMVHEMQRNQKRPINPEDSASVKNDSEEWPTIQPPEKKKKPVILGIPFVEVKTAYEGKNLFVSNHVKYVLNWRKRLTTKINWIHNVISGWKCPGQAVENLVCDNGKKIKYEHTHKHVNAMRPHM